MAQEAGLAVVVSMRDQLSGPMQQAGKTISQTRAEAMNFRFAMIAVGGVMMHMSSLLNQLDNPMAKSAADFLRMSGYIVMTANSVMMMIPQIQKLITWLRQLNVTMAITQALSGPKGWIALGIGAAVATGAVIAVSRAGQGQAPSQTTIVNNNVQGSVITERELGEITRREIIKTQDRSSSSGIR